MPKFPNKIQKAVSPQNAGKPPSPKQNALYTQLTGIAFPAGTNRAQASTILSQELKKNGGVRPGRGIPKPTAAKPAAAAAPAPKPKPAPVPKPKGIPDWPPKTRPSMPQECVAFAHLVPTDKDPDISNFIARQPMFKKSCFWMAERKHAIYNGEAGTGKTTMPKALAYMRNVPFLPISADSRMYSRELLGQVNIKNGTSFFTEGTFLLLTQIPSHIHVAEYNVQDTGAAMFWQSINNERQVYVKEADAGKGRVYKLHPDCYISFDANPPNARNTGTQRYSVPQLDRLAVVDFDSWTYDEIKDLLDKEGIPNSGGLAGFYVDAAKVIINGGYRCMLSIRGVRRIGKAIAQGFTPRDAFDMGVLKHMLLTGGPPAYEAVKNVAKASGFNI